MVALEIALPVPRRYRQESQALRTLRRLLRHRGALIGCAMVMLVGLRAILAPVIAPFDPSDMGVGPSLAPPSPAHLFGTDTFGRELFHRVTYSAEVLLMFILEELL